MASRWALVGACAAAIVLGGSCREVVYQTYGFKRVEARSSAGVVVSAAAETGRTTSVDSANATYDRMAGPYRIYLFVSGGALSRVEATFTPVGTRRTVAARFAGPQELTDTTTTAFVADSVALGFEDHDVVVCLWGMSPGSAPVDSVRFRLEKEIEERRTSLWDWLGPI